MGWKVAHVNTSYFREREKEGDGKRESVLTDNTFSTPSRNNGMYTSVPQGGQLRVTPKVQRKWGQHICWVGTKKWAEWQQYVIM